MIEEDLCIHLVPVEECVLCLEEDVYEDEEEQYCPHVKRTNSYCSKCLKDIYGVSKL